MSRPENPTIGFLRLRQRRILEVRESTLGRSFGHAPGVALSTYVRQEGKLRRGLSANDLEERWSPISEVCLDQDDINHLELLEQGEILVPAQPEISWPPVEQPVD